MKRYLVKVVFFLFGSIVFAQKVNWDVGLRGGLNVASLAENSFLKNQQPIYTPSFYLTTDYEIIKFLRIEYSLGYIAKGDQFEFRVLNGPEYVGKAKYISNQIVAKGRFGEKILIMPKIGVSVDKSVAYEFLVIGYPNSIVSKNNSKLEHANSWNNGVVFGLDLRMTIGKKVGVEISGQFIQGLDSITKEEFFNYSPEIPANFMILAGAYYRIKPEEKRRKRHR